MKPCQIDMLLARAQVVLALVLIGGFFLLTGGMVYVLAIKGVDVKGSALTLLTTALTAAITMASGATGYFFLRHRPATAADADGPPSIPTQPVQPAQLQVTS